MSLEQVSDNRCFGGQQLRFKHTSDTLDCEMHFSVFVPPHQEKDLPLPALYWLSGLTCNDQNFVTKAGAQRVAAELGLLLIIPDTSPRGDAVPDDPDEAYDFGKGAGFYLNATQAPWAEHYQMYDYIVEELPALVRQRFRMRQKAAIAGHSMGGHGALTIALSNMQKYASASAFSPIVNPMDCAWGQKAFRHYLGQDKNDWQQYDACHLMEEQGKFLQLPMRIDQGLQDEFLDTQKLTRPLESVADKIGYPAEFYYHEGYDHSYFFVASFIELHLRFHASHLQAQ